MSLRHLPSSSRILSLTPLHIQGTILQYGARRLQIDEETLVARVRTLSVTIAFFYRSHHITDCGSWIAIAPAIKEAEVLARRYGLTASSEGEIRVSLEVTDASVCLVQPDPHTTLGLPYREDPLTDSLLVKMAGQEPRVQTEAPLWSTLDPAAINQSRLDRATLLERAGRAPHQVLADVRAWFRRTP